MKKKIFTVHEAEESTGFLLWQVTKVWERAIKSALKKYGITHPQFVVLASMLWFHLHEVPINQITLSTHTKIDPMTLSVILRTLERDRYVKRMGDKSDMRAKQITLTSQSMKIITGAIQTIERVDKLFFQRLKNISTKDFNRHLLALLANQSGNKRSNGHI